MFSLLWLAAVPDFETVAKAIEGRVGVYAAVMGTSSRVGLHETERYPMQSVYKFPIAMAVLHRVDEGELRLDQVVRVGKAELVPAELHSPVRDLHPVGDFDISLRDLVRYAVSESDGTASDVLLRVLGGVTAANDYVRGVGVQEVTIATTEQEMARDGQAQYRSWATPRGMVQLLSLLAEGKGLSAGSRELLMKFMTETETGLKRIRGSLPAGTVVAHKTGTSGSREGFTAATNDVGLVKLPDGRWMAVAVFVADARGSVEVREGVIAELGRLAFRWGVGR